jgi:predicted transcriptional regulator YdeE
MENTTVTRESFLLVGIAARTTNAAEMQGLGKIPALWGKFYAERYPQRIPGIQTPGEIIAAYTDFTSDENGEYTIIIGAAVEPGTVPPEGMMAQFIAGGEYLNISTGRGKLAEIGVAAWQAIWQNQPLKARRAYNADLEIYGADTANPEDARFDIYLSLKEI